MEVIATDIKELLSRYSCEIFIESLPGKGSKFIVELPPENGQGNNKSILSNEEGSYN